MNKEEEEEDLGYYFLDFVKTCEAIRNTQGKNKKIEIIAKYISKLNHDSYALQFYFFQERCFQEDRLII